jgi:cell division protein FtsB
MAAKVCRACGAVTLTVDKNEMSKLQNKPKSSQLFIFFFVILMSTLFAYTEYHVNFLEKELVKKHDQIEKKDAEIKQLTKNLAALSQPKHRD